ncbi:conserved hypothetical protein [Candidatus Phytoplasma mali]|uniref:Uncharacterized protein n=1 Tax=Phytoplasma mali (strain AT) TaxID=482235 RepID=B3QZL7_PHYMT|nr:hypothetical protein [Candidatus Phytoplasma mali]CAP18404.1 conserved hypothetical protein [Candidatus Phytoplasma mali]
MVKNKIKTLKTKLTKLKCQNIEIIQNNKNEIKEINFDFEGIDQDSLQFLQIKFYTNGNLRRIQCLDDKSIPNDKDFTYDFYDENNQQAFKICSFSIVLKVFKYLKTISNILQNEYFIPILDNDDDEETTYNLMSTKTFDMYSDIYEELF